MTDAASVSVTATVASFVEVMVDGSFAFVRTNDPDAVAWMGDREMPLNELVCLTDPPRLDDRPTVRLRRIA